MEGLQDPLDPRLRGLLRHAVLDHVSAERRRVHPPVLHVGVPGDRPARLVLDGDEHTDPGLRADVVAAMRAGTQTSGRPEPLVWLTRTGALLELQDVDARWLAAARAAYAEAEATLVMVVVTRSGWRDPRSGLSRTWARLRPRADRPQAS